MTDVAQDIKDRLVTQSVGTFAATSGWGIYVGQEPATPDTVITIYNTGSSIEPNAQWRLEGRSFQVRIRGAANGYQDCYSKAEDIKNELLGLGPVTLNSTNYIGIWAVTNVTFLRYDENRRPIFVINFRAMCEPTESDNREAL